MMPQRSIQVPIRLSCAVLAAAVAGSARGQVPAGFEFVRLTHDADKQHSVPEINDKGEVVWREFIVPNYAVAMLFSNGVITQLTEADVLVGGITINNLSQIVWTQRDSLQAPFDLLSNYVPGPMQGTAGSVDSIILDMNDRGDVVWNHNVGDGARDVFLYQHDSGSVVPITAGGNNPCPRLNESREIVWTLFDFNAVPWEGQILRYAAGTTVVVNPSTCACQGPDINDAGQIVWQDPEGVIFSDVGEEMLIAPLSGTPRINDHGDIGLAIWDPELQLARHALYRAGQLYILPHAGLTTARSSINDRGEMAMKSIDPNTGNSDLFLLRRIGADGDFGSDCHIDLHDFAILEACFTGADLGPPGGLLAACSRGDFDDDGDIDHDDVASFVLAMTGPAEELTGCPE